jgi:DNA-binding transcriptional LysR family regulator
VISNLDEWRMRSLDLEAVQAFVLVADFKSFTRAAEALGSTQSAVSVKLKRLEERLKRTLVERTPRRVRLSADGELFLEAARGLVAAQERALATFAAERRRVSIGISHHIVGAELPVILKRMGEQEPALTVEIHVAPSDEVLRDFDDGGLDAAFVLRHDSVRRDGEVLMQERFGWFAASDFGRAPGEPIRIATQSATCGLRETSIRALEAAKIPWTEVFVGGGVATIGAAVSAGLAVAALARRCAPVGAIDVGAKLSLPALPPTDVVLHTRVSEARSRAALRNFAAAFRATAVK